MAKNELQLNSIEDSPATGLVAPFSSSVLLAENEDTKFASHDCATEADSLPSDGATETTAQRRRRLRIALLEEFGGNLADIKTVAQEAIRRGMYSPRTRASDVELSFIRTWKLRNRKYNR
jgi:hypothetical protein